MTRIIRLVCEEIMVARPISNTHIPHIKIITNTAGRSRKKRNGSIKNMTFNNQTDHIGQKVFDSPSNKK